MTAVKIAKIYAKLANIMAVKDARSTQLVRMQAVHAPALMDTTIIMVPAIHVILPVQHALLDRVNV
jgi:hypothetical protein